jgi:hypothetical protein
MRGLFALILRFAKRAAEAASAGQFDNLAVELATIR